METEEVQTLISNIEDELCSTPVSEYHTIAYLQSILEDSYNELIYLVTLNIDNV
ncbi:MAG: hypothetical protein KAH32_01085 [Chlamydiia bacterium]|nr:hypothetical protein [Chlamydiia bacterium]